MSFGLGSVSGWGPTRKAGLSVGEGGGVASFASRQKLVTQNARLIENFYEQCEVKDPMSGQSL